MKSWTALALDLLVVVVFAAVGRLSHAEGADAVAIALTAWPFVVGLVGTTVALLGMKRPTEQLLNGVIVWLGTLVFGMWIRAGSGAGVQPSFAIVAGIFLVVTMLGWRLIARVRLRRSAPSHR
ncbi:MAG: DUF3054 domain-containing protein [Micropruina sp.]|uniref:DUF3054 domain-containing protein n=1 Tax=Micropruina sp. TaxID=2737536 RepID=UPI0039E44F37